MKVTQNATVRRVRMSPSMTYQGLNKRTNEIAATTPIGTASPRNVDTGTPFHRMPESGPSLARIARPARFEAAESPRF